MLHTITADNGKEFAGHEKIAKELEIDIYFAKPYHSWERGANENTNGLIRQYFPKGTSFENITNEQVVYVQNKLNNRPRKKLGFLSPNEFFYTNFEKKSCICDLNPAFQMFFYFQNLKSLISLRYSNWIINILLYGQTLIIKISL